MYKINFKFLFLNVLRLGKFDYMDDHNQLECHCHLKQIGHPLRQFQVMVQVPQMTASDHG